MDESLRVHVVEGRARAMEAMLLALVMTHPDRAALRKAFQVHAEGMREVLAHDSGTRDETIENFDSLRDWMRTLLAA